MDDTEGEKRTDFLQGWFADGFHCDGFGRALWSFAAYGTGTAISR
jgi:predicted NAD/FAD-binding protein